MKVWVTSGSSGTHLLSYDDPVDWDDWDDDEREYDEFGNEIAIPRHDPEDDLEADDNWCCYPGLECHESSPDADLELHHGSPGQ